MFQVTLKPGQKQAQSTTPQQTTVTLQQNNYGLNQEELDLEIAACGASFEYFCFNYFYLVEPRIYKDSDKDSASKEQASFDEYFANLEKKAELTTEALALLFFEMQELEEIAKSEGRKTELLFKWWKFQQKAAAWLCWMLDNGNWGVIEKCRDMGMTWLVLAFYVWKWRFTKNFHGLVGSRKQEAVDNGKLDSLFGKLDYAVSKLPEWLLPKGFIRRKHRTFMSLVNPENGSFITGDSQTADFGRSGRYTSVFVDEYDSWDNDIIGSVLNATNNLILGSTVHGKGLMWSARERALNFSAMRVLRMEWFENPKHLENNWFENMKTSMEEHTFASEVLIDYDASVKGKYYPICNLVPIRDSIKWENPAEWPSFVGMDFGVRDECALIWAQKKPYHLLSNLLPNEPIYRMMYCYSNNGQPIEYYIPFLKVLPFDECVPERDIYTNEPKLDAHGKIVYKELTKLYDYGVREHGLLATLVQAGVSGYSLTFRGDPAGRNRNEVTATSSFQVLATEEVFFEDYPGKPNSHIFRRDAATGVLMRTEVNKEHALPAFNAIQLAKYPEHRETSNATTIPTSPVHDWTSHYRSAWEYICVGEAPEPEEDKPAPASVFAVSVPRGNSNANNKHRNNGNRY
jgi:hypothetical protein